MHVPCHEYRFVVVMLMTDYLNTTVMSGLELQSLTSISYGVIIMIERWCYHYNYDLKILVFPDIKVFTNIIVAALL